MEIRFVKFSLLNHLFYYSEISGGSTSATTTSNFIGDLALNYALSRKIKEFSETSMYKMKPEYEEIANFGFYCSIAKPINIEVEKTDNYTKNTLFNTDGFLDVKSIEKSGKSPYKNYRQAQGIKVGTEFISFFISKDNIKIPKTIRVGTGRETLIKVEEIPLRQVCDNDWWLNAYSLKIIFKNLDKVVDIMIKENKVNFNYILENYVIIKNISISNIKEIFKEIF